MHYGTNNGKAAGLSGIFSPRDLPWEFIPDKPKAFPLFVRLLWIKNRRGCSEGLPEESPEGGFRLNPRDSMSIEGSDFP